MFMFSVWMTERQISVGHVAEIRNETKIYGALLIVSCVTQFQSHRCFCSFATIYVCVCSNGLLFSNQSEYVKLAVHEQVFNDNIYNVFSYFRIFKTTAIPIGTGSFCYDFFIFFFFLSYFRFQNAGNEC